MPRTDALKRVIPVSADQADVEVAFTNFSSTVHAPIPVSGATEAAQVADAAPDEAFPLWTSEDYQLFMQPSRDMGRRQVAGVMASCQGRLHGPVLSGVANEIRISDLTHVTPGWTLPTDTRLRVPQDGLYLVQAKTYITKNGEPWTQLLGATLEVIMGGERFPSPVSTGSVTSNWAMWRLTAGADISVRCTQATGVDVTANGSFLAVQLAS